MKNFIFAGMLVVVLVFAGCASTPRGEPSGGSPDALAYLNNGRNLFDEGKWDEAIAEFDKALAINRDLADAYYWRGSAYDRKHDVDKAIADYTQAIRINPNYARAYNDRGFLFFMDKYDFDQAIADFEAALRIDPNHTDAKQGLEYARRHQGMTALQRADENYDFGLFLLNDGNYRGAIRVFTALILFNSNYVDAYNTRGWIYGEIGDYDSAIADYTQVIRLNPNYIAGAYNGRGWYYALKGDYDQAIADANTSLRISPNVSHTLHTRGYAYLGKLDYDRAIADFEAALRIDPSHAEARRDLETARQQRGPQTANEYNSRGLDYLDNSDYDRAIADFTQAIRLNPNYASAYNNRGVAYLNKCDHDRAIADLTQAIRLDPNFALAYTHRGYAYAEIRDFDRSIVDLEAALRINPNNSEVRNNLEFVRQQRGR